MSNTQSRPPAVKSEKKKIAIALALLVVGAVLWGRMYYFKSAPAAAQGQTPEAADPAGQDSTAASAGAVTPAQASAVRAAVTVVLPGELNRDLFAINAGYYPTKPSPNLPVIIPVSPNSSTRPVDDHERMAQQQALAAKAGLVLEFTLMGSKPRAKISGQMLAVGEKINGLTIRHVFDRKVVLEMNGIEVALEQ
jgi:hypothetical protein